MVPTTLVENVKKRAFELYQKRGGKPGNDQDDWYMAEKEIMSQSQYITSSSNKSNDKKRPQGRS